MKNLSKEWKPTSRPLVSTLKHSRKKMRATAAAKSASILRNVNIRLVRKGNKK